jgi:hypothetical protein
MSILFASDMTTGEQFNDTLFYTVMSNNWNQQMYTLYADWDFYNECSLTFTRIEHIDELVRWDSEHLVQISIPHDAKINESDGGKIFFADKYDLVKIAYIDELLDDTACIELITRESNVFKFTSKQNPKVCETAIALCGSLISYVNYPTSELCMIAVKDKACNISLFDPIYQTYEMCESVLLKNGSYLRYLRKDLLNYTLYLLAVGTSSMAISYIDKEYHTTELCEICVKCNGMALQYCREDLQTEQLCTTAVTHTAEAIKFVKNKTHALCETAVCSKPLTIQYIEHDILTPKVCRMAIRRSYGALSFIPEHLQTENMCLLAFRQHVDKCSPLKYIINKTDKLCNIAVKLDGMALEYVPDELKTVILCKIAMTKTGMALQYVPDELKTPELCEIAVKNNGMALQYVPNELKTITLCKYAVDRCAMAIKYVPDEMKTRYICETAVTNNGFAVDYVPKNLITNKIYEDAIKYKNLTERERFAQRSHTYLVDQVQYDDDLVGQPINSVPKSDDIDPRDADNDYYYYVKPMFQVDYVYLQG